MTGFLDLTESLTDFILILVVATHLTMAGRDLIESIKNQLNPLMQPTKLSKIAFLTLFCSWLERRILCCSVGGEAQMAV